MRCSLPDMDPATWDPEADKVAASDAEYAAATLVSFADRQQLDLDFELDRDGCPWGWATSRWSVSVSEYMGQRSTDSPVRSLNPKLWRRMMRDEAEPTELLDAVALLAAYQDGAYAQFHEILNR